MTSKSTPRESADEPAARKTVNAKADRHFVTALATASGAFSTLVIAALWYPTWVIAPCFA